MGSSAWWIAILAALGIAGACGQQSETPVEETPDDVTCFHRGLDSEPGDPDCGLDFTSECSPVSVFEGPDTAEAKAAVVDAEGRAAVVGFLDMAGDDRTDYDAFITRTDAEGTELWTQTFDTGGFDYAEDVIATPDGGFLIVGYSVPETNDPTQALIVRTDENGEVLWQHLLGGELATTANSVVLSAEGHAIIGGGQRVYHDHGYGPAVYLVALDDSGEELWSGNLGADHLGRVEDLVETSEGDLVLVTERYEGLFLVAADGAGEVRWNIRLSAREVLRPRLEVLNDGGLIVSANDGHGHVTLIRADPEGGQLWTAEIAGIALDLGVVPDRGIFLAGHASGDGDEQTNVLLAQIDDSDGRELWRTTYGGRGEEVAWAICPRRDGSFALAGGTTTGAHAADGPAMRAFLLLADEHGEML